MRKPITAGETGTLYDADTGEVIDRDVPSVVQLEECDPNAMTERDLRDFIGMSHLVPNVDWIMQHVVGKGARTYVDLGILVGWCNRASIKRTEYQGKALESICLDGAFILTKMDGTEIQAPSAYLPKAWARQVLAILGESQPDAPPGNVKVKMVLTLGVEATGKPIPYAWRCRLRTARQSDDPDLAELQAIAARPLTPSGGGVAAMIAGAGSR